MSQTIPRLTATGHLLNFSALEPLAFERMCVWLVKAEGFQSVQHLGASGFDDGIDILASKNGEVFAFQCKRVGRFAASQAETEIRKLLKLPTRERPRRVIFVVSCKVSARTRRHAAGLWGGGRCEVWAETELDERVKRHGRIIKEFFGYQIQPTHHQPDPIPAPPLLYAVPLYVASHKFVGRRTQLSALDRWSATDGSPVLLIDAIGGAGKSQLAWEWLARRAKEDKGPWAGCYWYSFYEKGAVLDEFCIHALAYMTGTATSELRKLTFSALSGNLIQYLRLKPWIVVLDGLERVLAGYHRFDAAHISDDEADSLTDPVAARDPTAAVRGQDDEFLRLLAGADPSKFLITTRLLPRALTNQASRTIDGVKRMALPGLQVGDAEKLIRACGVIGTSSRIRAYLKSNCDSHPLVVGALAGLINRYLPARGNFDVWENNPAARGGIDLGKLDLKQKRNHILRAALDALTDQARSLLSKLALIYGAVDWDTLEAFNSYDQDRMDSPETESRDLNETVSELEGSGLLQYDTACNVYDLHPVVRHVVVAQLKNDDKNDLGQRVADHFSQIPHDPFEKATSLDDVLNALRVVRALLVSGQIKKAYNFYYGDLANALAYNMNAAAETLALIRPLFPGGWATPPIELRSTNASNMSNVAGMALQEIGQFDEARVAFGAAVQAGIQEKHWNHASIYVRNLAGLVRFPDQVRLTALAYEIATIYGEKDHLFIARMEKFKQSAHMGLSADADDLWRSLGHRPASRAHYRPGDAEYYFALYRYWVGDLSEKQIKSARRYAKLRPEDAMVRVLKLEGGWRLEQKEWSLAAECLAQAVDISHSTYSDPVLETMSRAE